MHWSKWPNWQAISFHFTSKVRINGSERNASGKRLSGERSPRRPGFVLAIANFLLCIPSYSTFFDSAHRRPTGLAHYLEKQPIKEIYLISRR